MSAPVDVLAVIRRDAAHADAYRIVHGVLDATPQQLASESEEARAAVAELIETQRELLLEIDRSMPHTTDVMQRIPCDTLRRATNALARVGGAA